MSNQDQPLEPNVETTQSNSFFRNWFGGKAKETGEEQEPAGHDQSSVDIPVVEEDEIRSAVRSSRQFSGVRCNLQTAIASLSTLDRGRVIIVTPDNEPNQGCAVSIARVLSQKATTIVVDMAGDSRASREMLGDVERGGVMDVLLGAQKVSDCIYNDVQSSAHIMPTGRAVGELTSASAQLLPVVINALQGGYQYLLIDAGGADATAIKRISDQSTGIVLCSLQSTSIEIDERLEDLREQGFEEPVVVDLSEAA